MTIGKIVIDDMIFAIMRIDVLALDGVFDTGLTALLDVFSTANELSGGKRPLRVRTVGVQGDFRTYAQVIALRAVTSQDAMTADWARLPYELLGTISNRIINEVKGINRVVFDISSKPPSTIEWE